MLKKKTLHQTGQSTYIFNILAESRDAGGAHNHKFSFRIQNHMVEARRFPLPRLLAGPTKHSSLCGPERLSLRKSTIDSKRQYLPLVSDQSYFFCFLLILIWRVRSSFKKQNCIETVSRGLIGIVVVPWKVELYPSWRNHLFN